MKLFLDHSIDFDKRISAFKEMVNKAIEIQGYIEFKMTDDDGEDRFYFIDKKNGLGDLLMVGEKFTLMQYSISAILG